MYAIVKSGGKQYKVAPGDVIEIEHIDLKPKDKVVLDEILLVSLNGSVAIGKPRVTGVVIKGVVMDHLKGPKIRVSKFKSKSRYRRTTGHRQSLTKVKIEEIVTKRAA